ncbi:MAG TPA: hypothetical protein VGQ52_09495, partial [Gemmatimonadaceae bacterium]|nr:hypothetical protein [Gemmatimonadaceae bacterium]
EVGDLWQARPHDPRGSNSFHVTFPDEPNLAVASVEFDADTIRVRGTVTSGTKVDISMTLICRLKIAGPVRPVRITAFRPRYA